MYTLITYDVNTIDAVGRRRLRQVAKTCQDYGQRVQNSVFDLGKDYKSHIESFGRETSYETEVELIIWSQCDCTPASGN